MTPKQKPEAKTKEIAVVPEKAEDSVAFILQGNPDSQVEYAKRAAKALVGVLKNKKRKVVINGRQYLEFSDWQMLARFYGVTVGIEWTEALFEEKDSEKKCMGFQARAVAYHNGQIISSAEAMCTRDESRWATAADYAIRSMSQTRACAKALRQVFGWVPVLEGLADTPAEEMEGVDARKGRATPKQTEWQV